MSLDGNLSFMLVTDFQGQTWSRHIIVVQGDAARDTLVSPLVAEWQHSHNTSPLFFLFSFTLGLVCSSSRINDLEKEMTFSPPAPSVPTQDCKHSQQVSFRASARDVWLSPNIQSLSDGSSRQAARQTGELVQQLQQQPNKERKQRVFTPTSIWITQEKQRDPKIFFLRDKHSKGTIIMN